MEESRELHNGDLYYRHHHSPYVGKIMRGRIERTMVRGNTVFLDGKFTSSARGKLIEPQM
jgi:allantoinase